jgi:glycosyltransferase involved in cell wall biosynthesis
MPELPPLPPIAGRPLSVVLLARDAAGHVEAVVSGWAEYLDRLGREYELIVVDAASTDTTADLLEALLARLPRLLVVRAKGRGDGAALRPALTVARHPLLFYTFCEPAYRPADLGRLLDKRLPPKDEPEIDQVHLMTGYRAGRRVPWPLRVVGWLWRLFCRVAFSYPPDRLPGWLGLRRHAGRQLARALFAVRYQDVACPFRLVRREVFARIPIQSDGPFAHVEVLAKANFLGCILSPDELPLDVTPGPAGDVRGVLADGWRVLTRPTFGPVVPQDPCLALREAPASPPAAPAAP